MNPMLLFRMQEVAGNSTVKKAGFWYRFSAFVLLAFFMQSSIQAQIQLIPASDGGFEASTSSFAANGWTDVQPGNVRQWRVGTPPGSVTGGTKAAYIGNSGSFNGTNSVSVQHFYRDVALPATANNVRLRFYLRRPTVDPGDNLFVYVTTTSNTPVSGTVPGAGYTTVFSNNTSTYSNFTLMSAINLDSWAGSTVRVVFTFQSDGSSPHSNPAIDNVTLSANIPPIISGFNPASGCTGSGTITITGSYLTGASAVTIGGTPVSSITSNTDSEIQAVIGSGTTGLVAVTTTYGTGNSASNYTVNPLPTLFSVTGGGSYCSGGSGVAIGLSGSQVGVNYTLNPAGVVVAGTGSAISFGNQTSAGSYTVTATNVSTGCTSNMTGSASVGIINVPVISAQPTDQSVCAGASVSFSTTASGGTLSYQWRKGTTNLSNGGSISGATSATLTINPAVLGDAATDYNCVITNTCGSVETDFATLGVSSNAIAPSAQASALTFPTVGVTSIIGSFTPSASATHYLVVRTPTVLPPANPVNGTTYPVGSAALGLGTFVEYSGIATEFTSNGLDQGTTYYYWVFAYNTSICGTSPVYRVSSPLNGSVTTTTNVACGLVTTLYWAGTGSNFTNPSATTDFNTASNWSTSSAIYLPSLSAPGQCNNVNINLRSTTIVTLSQNTSVYNLDFTAQNAAIARLSVQGFTLTVNGNAYVDLVAGTNNNTRILIGENSGAAGVVDFKGNLRIGTNGANFGSNKVSYFWGNSTSKIIMRADVLLGRTFAISGGARPGTIEFDGAGLQQVLWNNDMYFANFTNVVVGNQNNPIVRHVTGTYTPDNILNNLTVNGSSVLDLATSQWIRDNNGGTFSLNGTSKLILSNDRSIPSPASGLGVVVPGSNFPGGFSTMNISANSTVEYSAAAGINQTIWSTPNYGNLVLSNEAGTGSSIKTNTGTVSVRGTTEVKSNTIWNMGANMSTIGSAFVKSGAELQMGTNIISGTGSFTLESGGTLGIGSAQGITSSGATGNVQTSGRNFSTGGNYIYNSTGAANTGNGLPTTMANLTINNTSGITLHAASANYTVSNTIRLTTGAFVLNGNTLTINNLIRNSGTFSSSPASSVVVNGTNVPLFFTAGFRFIRNLTINDNASASLGSDLDIAGGTNYGTLSVGSGATLNTQNRLTLRSNATGTARVAEIPANPTTGAALGTITGNVTVERFISAQRAWRLLAVPTAGSQTIRQSWQENQPQGSTSLSGRGFQISGETFPANGFDMLSTVPSVKVWDPSIANYTGITSTLTPIVSDAAYMTFIRGDRTINYVTSSATTTILRTSGTLKTGKYPSSALTVNAGEFRAIGNPYASAIDFNKLTRTGGVPNTFYVWDPKLTTGPSSTYGFGGFRTITWDSGSGTYIVTPSGGSYTTNTLIESGSGFMVYAPISSGTIQFTEDAKSDGSNLVSRVSSRASGKQIRLNLFTISAGDTVMVDGNMVQFGGYANDLDELDALKMNNTGENIGIRRQNKNYIVERRSDMFEYDTIPYAIGQMRARPYILELELAEFNEPGMDIILEDQFLQTRTSLQGEGTTKYTFSVTSAPASYASGRFRVLLRNHNPIVPASIVSISAIRQSDNRVQVQWQVNQENRIGFYELQRSADGTNYETILFVDPFSNNGTNTQYAQLASQAPSGTLFYRVRATQTCSSAFLFSPVARVQTGKNPQVTNTLLAKGNGTPVIMESSQPSVQVYPNPVVNKTMQLAFNQKPAGNYPVQLISGSGQVVYQSAINLREAKSVKTLKLGAIAPGTYQLLLTDPAGQRETISVVIL